MSSLPPSAASLFADLERLQSYASQLQRVIKAADDAAPAQASAHDSGNVAEAVVDRAGTPAGLRVVEGWERRTDAESLGPALLEAYQTAVQQHLTAWGEDLERTGWKYDAREVEQRAAEQAPALFRAPVGTSSTPRSIESLLEQVIGELDASHRLASGPTPPPEPQSFGAEGGRVSVQITRGALSGVHVDPEWARGRSAAAINGELAQALQTARITATQPPRRDPHADRLDDLFGDVMTFLQAHREQGAR